MLPAQKNIESVKKLIADMKNPEYLEYQSGWLPETLEHLFEDLTLYNHANKNDWEFDYLN